MLFYMLFIHVFTAIPPRLSDPRNFITVPGTGADDAFVLKHCVPFTSRPAIAVGARQFQVSVFSLNILTACLFTYCFLRTKPCVI